MNWLQLELTVAPSHLDEVEDCLFGSGATSVTLLNERSGHESERQVEQILEPDPGATPLWTSIRLQALLPLEADLGALRQQLAEIDGQILARVGVDFVDDSASAVSTSALDQVFGKRLWLRPKSARDEEGPDEDKNQAGQDALEVMYLEAGLAFGSGSHPTTQLCLEWLAQHVQAGQRVLDFGCGSGILAIGAACLGAHVVAVDHDEQAVIATRENAHYNSVDEANLQVLNLVEWSNRTGAAEFTEKESDVAFDVLVANILARPLVELAEGLQAVVKPGGRIVLSGILHDQVPLIRSAYAQTEFAAPLLDGDWACIAGVRR